MKLFLNEIK